MNADTFPDDPAQLRALLEAERSRRQRAEAEVARLHPSARIPKLNPNPVLRLSATGELQYANPAAELLAAELRTTGPSRVRPVLVQAATQAIRTGESVQRELTANKQHYMLIAVPVLEDNYTMLYLTDITARRQAEQEIHVQHEFYETILNYLPAVVTVLGPDQHYRYINPYAEPNPQVRQERIGSTFMEHCAKHGLPPALAVRRHRLFELAVRTRELVRWEEKWPGPDGEPALYWLCFYQPVFSPEGVLRQVMCYGLDITTRRRAEERTRESEAAVLAQQNFTHQVLDLNPNMIYVRDAHMNILFENQALSEWREMITSFGGINTPRTTMLPEEALTAAATDKEVLRTGQQRMVEERVTLPTGEVRWYQSVKCALNQEDGTPRVLVVSTDITALKQAQHVAEAAATARENFLANMSHEIRTPLNGVLGMTSLLAKTPLDEQQRNYTDVIQHSGRHLLNVVNDVLDMAKITSGNLELEQIAFNLCDSMGQAVQPLVLQAQEKGIRVVGALLRDSCPHPWVVGDPYRLNQILINLVSNAIKFTPAGGTVTVGGYFVSETSDHLTTEWRVTDTGIGIAPDKLHSIFQEFTQAYADTARQFGGTGLGLSISRALVQQMGGDLKVQSEPARGSSFSFTITLPKASHQERLAAQSPTLALPDTSAVRGRRVLLVEDNPVNREVAQLLLESHGVLVDSAESGQEALVLFEAQPYDAVLMDIQMPGMNGLEATARIRAHEDPIRAAIPILALTANAFHSDAEKYRAAGMNDTLAKPFDEVELLAKLALLLLGPEASPARPQNEAELATTEVLAASLATAQDSEAEAKPYDLALLHKTAHGSTAFINRILTSFHNNTPASLHQLRVNLAESDWAGLAALAHKLRPSLRLLGAASIIPHLEMLEAEAATDDERQAAAQGLEAGLKKLLEALPQELPEMAT